MSTKKAKGLTVLSVFFSIVPLGFIAANEFNINGLIRIYEWLFYLTCVFSVIGVCGLNYIDYQLTKTRYQFEIIKSVFIGLMLAYYGYFVCATVLVFCYCIIVRCAYVGKGK